MVKKPKEFTIKQYHLTGKTCNQKQYIKTISAHDIILCYGPAGTGKTHIAVASAILGLLKQKYKKIVITRPLVHAGENIGYLPGDILQKSDPYMKPIYDELEKYCEMAHINSMIANGQIEILPFAYMRGRNLHNSFIVVDESQNATFEQLTMLLTRFGNYSKMVLTGDILQSDLLNKSGFEIIIGLLRQQDKQIGIIELTDVDIVRHRLVAKIVQIIKKYYDEKKNK